MLLNRFNIRQRILLIFILITVAGGGVQFLIAGRQLQSATLEFFHHHLETDAQSAADAFADPLAHTLEGEQEGGGIDQLLVALQRQVGHDYLLVDVNYRVIAYTVGSGHVALDHVQETPELMQARMNRIGAAIRPNPSGQETLYVAVPVVYEGHTVGFLVLSELMQPAYDEVNQRYIGLGIATLPVILLVIAASLWISSTISSPVQNLRNSALRMANGALDTRISITSHDEVGQLAESFNYMAGQLDSLIKTQRSFVSNAAHELRTPLMTLKLRAEALADETLPTAERDTYLSEIRQEIDHIAELVSSLLVLARIDEGRHPQQETMHTFASDTVSTLHDVLRNWRIEAEAHGLNFSATIDDDLPDFPMSPYDLRLVLDNLLSNAIKYTVRGKICVSVTYQKNEFTIEVADTGVGFLPEQGARLFDRFYRSEQVRGKFAGNGLGLSIVKGILDRYGGQITAYSAGVGQGAAFTIRLQSTPVLSAAPSK